MITPYSRPAILADLLVVVSVGWGLNNSSRAQMAPHFPSESRQTRHQTTDTAPAETDGAQPHGDAVRSLRADDLKGLGWRNVGPAIMGGRVADIGLAPGNAKTFYVAFGTSGLFK